MKTDYQKRLDYCPHSAHKGHQVTTGLAFKLESAVMLICAIAFTAFHYAGLFRMVAALFN
ncbi:membrane protein [Rhodobacter phage RcPacific]|nr:membrane protein [Rhodobacter phage RcPescado]UUV44668.1 membrane protein [Rhodobacter phage RcPacific]UUV45015.1 membrane protein [Rhodobacter phage RcWata]